MASCVHIYCGDGKGKTTAAIGLAVRAVGRNKKVLIARFLKTDDSGEVAILAGIPGITVLPCEKTFGFYTQMSEMQKEEAKAYYGELLQHACQQAVNECYDMLILDEMIAACNYGLAGEDSLLAFLRERPERLEVVLTGRNPSKALMEQVDYVSEILKRKHPYDTGVSAREGIEY